jgi:lycopene beta-cyclase
MTNRPFPSKQGVHIINIGTAGGQTKPSTGYTFTRIQKQTMQLVDTLLKVGKPDIENSSFSRRFWWYDSILLNVLLKNRCSGKEVFTRLFKYNDAATILAFLDEQTNIFQELKITNTVPRLPFLKATVDLLGRR